MTKLDFAQGEFTCWFTCCDWLFTCLLLFTCYGWKFIDMSIRPNLHAIIDREWLVLIC